MEQELTQLQNIYTLITEFFVKYSFQLLGAGLILLIGLFIANRAARFVVDLCTRHNIDITLSRFLGSCTRIAIIVGVAVICLNKIGISVTPFVAAIGALSLGAGLAVQGLLSNYGAGLNIILTRPFIVGDTISVKDVTGVVKEVHLAYTLLSDEDEVSITIPNRHIIGEILHNSHGSKLVEDSVTVAYKSDPVQVIAVILSVLEKHEVTSERRPQIGIHHLAESGIEIGIRYWVPTERFHEIRYAINNGVYAALKQAGVEIPYPRRDVQLLNADKS